MICVNHGVNADVNGEQNAEADNQRGPHVDDNILERQRMKHCGQG